MWNEWERKLSLIEFLCKRVSKWSLWVQAATQLIDSLNSWEERAAVRVKPVTLCVCAALMFSSVVTFFFFWDFCQTYWSLHWQICSSKSQLLTNTNSFSLSIQLYFHTNTIFFLFVTFTLCFFSHSLSCTWSFHFCLSLHLPSVLSLYIVLEMNHMWAVTSL